MTLPSSLEATVQVSWDGSGAFTGANDDVTPAVLADPGVLIEWGRDASQATSPPKTSTGSVTLANEDDAYTQENPQSPVYQQVVTGRPVSYILRQGERRLYRSHTLYRDHVPYRGLATYPFGRQVINDISQTSVVGDETVKLDTIGWEVALTRGTVSVAVTATPLVSECFTAVLDAIGWPTDKRAISISDTRLLWFWVDERHPWDVFLDLLAAEGPGDFGVDLDGTFYFRNRNWWTTEPRATDSQATFFDVLAGSPTLYRAHVLYRARRLYRGQTNGLYYTEPYTYDPGLRDIFNRATYTVNNRVQQPVAKVWDYGAPLALGSGEVVTLIARPADPFVNAVTPALTTDYTVSGGTVSVALTYSSGLVAFIEITALTGSPTVNPSGTNGGLQLRAAALTTAGQTTFTNTVDASASIAKFSPIPGQNVPITLSVPGWPEINRANAEAVCDAWVNRLQNPVPKISITLENGDGDNLFELLERRVGDRVTIVRKTRVYDVWVYGSSVRVHGAGGRLVERTLFCEKADVLSGAQWDVDLWNDALAVWGV